jgi:hypothetical protein
MHVALTSTSDDNDAATQRWAPCSPLDDIADSDAAETLPTIYSTRAGGGGGRKDGDTGRGCDGRMIFFCLMACTSVKKYGETNIYRITFFFHLFFIADFCLFCPKGKSSVLAAQLFFVLPPRVITIYYAGNPYLSYGAKIILPPRILPSTQFPPPCLPPPPLSPRWRRRPWPFWSSG